MRTKRATVALEPLVIGHWSLMTRYRSLRTAHRPLFCIPLFLASLVLLSGCSLLRAPKTVVNTVVPWSRGAPPAPLQLQLKIERFADNFTLQTAQALDEFGRKAGTDSARVEALQLKLLSVSAVTSIASGPNPNVNLLDLVAVVTLGRIAVEDRWAKTANQPALSQWLDTSRALETSVWQLAASELKPTFIKELRETIEQWSAQHPEARDTFFARPQEYASMVGRKHKTQIDLNSVFSIVDLDPMAGLDPAVREVAQTRLLAERAMFTVQRMPFLLRFQTELLACQLADQPAMRLALTNVTTLAGSADRISRATESVSQTAAELPDRISTERKEILIALDQQEGKLRDLSTQVDHALQSGERMSTSLNTTLGTFDGLMRLFGVGQLSTNAAPVSNSPPFNVLDYGRVADQVGAMAKEINTLVGSVDKSAPQMQRLSEKATSDAQRVVDHGFRLGLVLIAVLLFGGLVAALLYRFLSEKLTRHQGPLSTPTP